MAEPLDIVFRANPTQRRFIESRAEADLWACRMGEGKSAGLVWSCFYHTQRNPGARWIFVRDTWVNLERTTQKEFFYWFPPTILGEYMASTKTFYWKYGELRGEVVFMGMDIPEDAHKLQSMPLAGGAIDEPAPAAESGGVDEFVFQTMMTRLRQPRMNWYAAKLAENAPDETHWTYRTFVDPGTENYAFHSSALPENTQNLPKDYYAKVRKAFSDRPDLQRRFAEGGFGFQQIGVALTPEWSDELHLTENLEPIPGRPLYFLWDFGQTPTWVVTQNSPLGHWNVLEAHVAGTPPLDRMGMEQFLHAVVVPAISERYEDFEWAHIGDPAGLHPEQSDSTRNAVRKLRKVLGGSWKSGAADIDTGLDAMRAVLSRLVEKRGMLQVDRQRARPVWHALRGGWRRRVHRTGVIGEIEKNEHSHPGDAMRYGASKLHPLVRRLPSKAPVRPRTAAWFNRPLGMERPGAEVPKEAQTLEG